MINELIKLANHLDDNGDYRQANYLDEMIKKNAQHATAAKIARWLKAAGKRAAPVVGPVSTALILWEILEPSSTAAGDDCRSCNWPNLVFSEIYKEVDDYHQENGFPQALFNIINNPKWDKEIVAEHNIRWIGEGPPRGQEAGGHETLWVLEPGWDDAWRPCCHRGWVPSSQMINLLHKELQEYIESDKYISFVAAADWVRNNPEAATGADTQSEGYEHRPEESGTDIDFDEDTDTDMDDGADSDTDTSIDTDVYVEPNEDSRNHDSIYMMPEDYEDYYSNQFNLKRYKGGVMINELIKLSTHLDNEGYYREANYIDEMIKKEAIGPFALGPALVWAGRMATAAWMGWEVFRFVSPKDESDDCSTCLWTWSVFARFLMDDVKELRDIRQLSFIPWYRPGDDEEAFTRKLIKMREQMPQGLSGILDHVSWKKGKPHHSTGLSPGVEMSCCIPGWFPTQQRVHSLRQELIAWAETNGPEWIAAEQEAFKDWPATNPCPSCHPTPDDYSSYDSSDWQEMIEPGGLDETSKDDLTRWLDEYSKSSTEEEPPQASPGSSSDQYYYGRGGQYPTR